MVIAGRSGEPAKLREMGIAPACILTESEETPAKRKRLPHERRDTAAPDEHWRP